MEPKFILASIEIKLISEYNPKTKYNFINELILYY